jgi:uncharacterized membrane protein
VEALVMYVLAQRIFRLDYDLRRTVAAMAVFAAVLATTQLHWSSSIRPVAMAGTLVVAFGLLMALGFERVSRY